jgi:hypothetical protein
MEVWRGHRHIAQARNPEHVQIGRILGDVGAPFVDGVAAGRACTNRRNAKKGRCLFPRRFREQPHISTRQYARIEICTALVSSNE